MTTTDFSISKLTVIDGEPNVAGNRLLASFTVVMPWITIRGCVLVEKATGLVQAFGPRGLTARGHTATTELTDPTLTRAITRRAAAIYTGYTGKDLSDE